MKTFAAHGVFGTSALTAVTAQNTLGVFAVQALPPELVAAQIDAVLSDLPPHAIKIGMLANAAIAAAVAARLRAIAVVPVVLDTVMIAKGGASLLDAVAVDTIRRELIPIAAVVTPNVPEAEALTGMTIQSVVGLREAAARLVADGARAAVVKGGHLDGPAVDVLYDGQTFTELRADRVATAERSATRAVGPVFRRI